MTPHSFAEFCLRHPIGFPLALLVFSLPFSIYADEIKAFLRIPPQRIGVWILKARLSSSEFKLRQLVRMRKDIRYALARMFASCIFLGFVILSTVLVCALRLYTSMNQLQLGKVDLAFFYLIVLVVYYTLYRMWADMRLMRHAFKERHSIKELQVLVKFELGFSANEGIGFGAKRDSKAAVINCDGDV